MKVGDYTERRIGQREKIYKSNRMETWLVDVKQLRIPRPKFGTSSGSPPHHRNVRLMPREPPRDYHLATAEDFATPSSPERQMKQLQSDTEEIRQALQEKL